MKKVLILSYFFPPCNLTASQRAFGWAKYLKTFGYYPIIITRNWDIPISTPRDVLKPSGVEVVHEKNEGYEVYYLPYDSSLRDKLFVNYGESKYGFWRRILTFLELVSENFTNFFIPFKNIFDFADQYLEKNKDIRYLVVTANPFTLFRFGYLLQKKHKIKWLADYRDDWNTSDFNKKFGLIDLAFNRLKIYSEKKWVGTAEAITSVSEAYKVKISEFVKRPGYVMLNGFFEEDFAINATPIIQDANLPFSIVYNGSLYTTQEIEIFLKAFKKLVDLNREKKNIKIYFPGLLFDKIQAERIYKFLSGYESFVEITPRVSKQEVFRIQSNAHLLLMVSHKNLVGIPSSKLYEYIGFGKPILACPSDGDIIENTLSGYNLGQISNTSEDAFTKLNELYQIYESKRYETLISNQEFQNKYTRKESTAVLHKILSQFYLPDFASEMKKVIILAHDFPPYTSIGALRPFSWFKFFHEFGIYPIVITRQWDSAKQSPVDVVRGSEQNFETRSNLENGTIIRVPYFPNLRDKVILKFGMDRMNFIRRFLTFYYSVAKFISSGSDNTFLFQKQGQRVIDYDGCDVIIATGEPFFLFKYAYELSIKNNIPWISDYRDGWTTNSVNIPKTPIEILVNKFFEYCEKKYLDSVSIITNASPTYAEDFKQKYSHKDVKVVFNGYDTSLFENVQNISQRKDVFTITYAGILYPYHQLELFLDGFKQFIINRNLTNVQLLFLGIEFYPEQKDRLIKYDDFLLPFIKTTPRIPHEKVLTKLKESNLLLLLTDEKAKSLHAKVFEYLLSERKILLVKNDKGVLENILMESKGGDVFSYKEEITTALDKYYDEWTQTGEVSHHPILLDKYNRRFQAELLANMIKSLG
ncbi:MAG: hypothetical protein K1X82_04935 [Bacteroidia bacterium]|nr:hypothetical protein [Bacteroidia bacterium]